MTEAPAVKDVLRLVHESTEQSLSAHQANLVFQQLRVAPEGLVVHLAAFEIQRQVEKRWPGQYRVQLERDKVDLQIFPVTPVEAPYLFEFKVPWSGGLICSEIADDLGLKLADRDRAYEVVVFLRVLESHIPSDRGHGRGSVATFKEKLPLVLRNRHPG